MFKLNNMNGSRKPTNTKVLELKTAEDVRNLIKLKSGDREISPDSGEYNYFINDYKRDRLVITQRQDGLLIITDTNVKYSWLMTKEEYINL